MTPEQKSGFTRLMLRWPERRDALRSVVESRIMDLFEIYEQASIACDYWRLQRKPEALKIAAEYRKLVEELEQEIAEALDCSPRSCDH